MGQAFGAGRTGAGGHGEGSASIAARLVLAGLSLLAAAAPALAVTTVTSTFTVQITITASCVINSASTLNFGGSQGVLAANVDQTATIQVQCTNTTPYNIGLDAGTSPSATVTTRKMVNGGNTVSYAIYRDAARTLNWGNTVGTDTVTGTGSGAAQSITVYGRVPAQTTPAPAVYSDTVTVTVTY
jgi:spore coat protein U-like protein